MASDRIHIASGRFHRPGASRADDAVLLAQGKTLYVRARPEAGEPLAVNDLPQVAISSRIGRIPRRLTFSDGSLFETDDNDGVDRWLSQHQRIGFVHKMERFHPRLIAVLLAIMLLSAGIYRFTIPILVEIAVLVTPPVVTEWMAKGTLSSLDRIVFSRSEMSSAEQAAILADFEAVAAVSERGVKGYKLNFRKGGMIGPNAFALPDGTLVITDELVELAGQDRDMITGVLAHEIGHVEREHSLRQLYRAAGTAGLIMLITGDIGSAGEDILTNGAALLALSYSREAEAEADRISVELMAKAGRDPAAIGRFFALIEEETGIDGEDQGSFLSTHPGTSERRKAIEDYARDVTGK